MYQIWRRWSSIRPISSNLVCVCVGGEGMSDFEGVGEKICPKWGKEKKTLVEKNYRIDFETFCSINSERIMLWVPHRF